MTNNNSVVTRVGNDELVTRGANRKWPVQLLVCTKPGIGILASHSETGMANQVVGGLVMVRRHGVEPENPAVTRVGYEQAIAVKMGIIRPAQGLFCREQAVLILAI